MRAIVGVVLPRKVTRRFARIWKFAKVGDHYLAPAKHHNGKCFHITLDGRPAYTERYEMVGYFVRVGNDRYLAVARLDGREFHITPDGKPAYRERYDQVSDFMKESLPNGEERYFALGETYPDPLIVAAYGGNNIVSRKIVPGPHWSSERT